MVVRSPCQTNYPADAHPSAHKSVLESANPARTRSAHLDAPGQRHGQQPVSGTADPGVVKQDKSSRGSVDTTKTRSGPQRVRMSSGERPIGAAKGKQSDTEASCQTPPPLPPFWHTPCAPHLPGVCVGSGGGGGGCPWCHPNHSGTTRQPEREAERHAAPPAVHTSSSECASRRKKSTKLGRKHAAKQLGTGPPHTWQWDEPQQDTQQCTGGP